ncbi:S9 family peptidase [Longispora fulva]|uniref:Dipeptidyl aminopeptidase/acylaminoacyl peptidase n=1 Tax=Longispora fulva TaxID=619741 RepID=A0A8J7GFR7_9ACTN|nr:prolyl oligopeptidase family serine peptidase [Longispora fulva]MBG6136945.1 dipeptidyl aminopeptidase/acylaminoacyl peptidase [Longispora fulva]
MSDEPRWVQRFRAPNLPVLRWAPDAPDRAVYVSNASGALQVHTWDRATDTHHQLTDRPAGTTLAVIDRDGSEVWWFADTAGDERGRWMRQPFDGATPAVPATPELGPGWPVGLVLGRSTQAVGLSTEEGVTIHVGGRLLHSSRVDASVGALSVDETLLAVEHAEYADARHRAVRVLRVADGTVVGELVDEHGLRVVDFAPDGTRLLLTRDRDDRPGPLIWDPVTGAEHAPEVDLPGEVFADWYPDGRALLLRHRHHARDELYRHDLDTGELTRLDTPRGTIMAAAVRPDGTVEYRWSSAAHAPAIRRLDGTVVLASEAPGSVPLTDAWVGDVHALIARPEGPGPYPTVFLLHGGPDAQDIDQFYPGRAAYVDAGYCVIHVNYRGSLGYGTAWRDALIGRPGLPELEDTAAVYDWAVAEGIVDPARCVIGGASWGGYLTLLGLGTQPDRWAAGLAIVPIGDVVGLWEDEMEPVREYDQALFGGTPHEIPEVWARSSPITYVEHVRVPVLITVGENDPRCPARQVDTYVARLDALGKHYELHRFDAGHGSVVVAERIADQLRELDFLARHLPTVPAAP